MDTNRRLQRNNDGELSKIQRIRKGEKMEYHTAKTLRDKLNELIERGYGDYEVCITYDNGHGITSAHNDVEPKIRTSRAYGDKVIFAEDDEFVRGFE